MAASKNKYWIVTEDYESPKVLSARHDFNASYVEGGLNLYCKSKYRIISQIDNEWLEVEDIKTKKTGIVPSSYFSHIPMELRKSDHLIIQFKEQAWCWAHNINTGASGWAHESCIAECFGETCTHSCHETAETETRLQAKYSFEKEGYDQAIDIEAGNYYLLIFDTKDGWLVIKDEETGIIGKAPKDYFMIQENSEAQNVKDSCKVFVAIADYKNHSDAQVLSIKKGDLLEIIGNSDFPDYWYHVKNIKSGVIGDVPKSFVKLKTFLNSSEPQEVPDRSPENSLTTECSDSEKENLSKSKRTKKRIKFLMAKEEHSAGTSVEEIKYEIGDEFELLGLLGRHGRLHVLHLDSNLEGEIHESKVEEVSDSLWQHPWYHGKLSRVSAFTMLKSQHTGTFLVRKSQSNEGFTVSIKAAYNIYNWKINQREAKVYIDNSNDFDSIPELIKHFSSEVNPLENCKTLFFKKPATRQRPQLREEGEWEIPRSNIKVYRLLGSGYFGEVHEGEWTTKNGARKVAVKSLKPGKMSISKFLREAEVMKRLQHPNILRILGIVTKDPSGQVIILTEYMQNGDLRRYIMNDANKIHDDRHFFELSCHICTGMVYLEKRNVIHRDLAARNILVDENGTAKIADFGLTTALEDEEDYYRGDADSTFPRRWAALECLERLICTTKSDVWSFGVTMWEIFTRGERPFSTLKNEEVVQSLIRGQRLPKTTKYVQINEDAYRIMNRCWNKNPAKRDSFAEMQPQLERLFLDALSRLKRPATSE